MNEIIPFDNVPYVDPSQRADEAAVLASQMGGQQQTGNFMFLQVGSGATSFKVDPDGMWLGAEVMSEAPFSADMLGNVIMNSVLINGLSGAILASSIDEDGNFINQLISDTLNTQTKQILGEFIFTGSGALAIKTDANNGIWISPTGILAKKSGATTFALDTAGNATFSGNLIGASGTFGTVTAGTITGVAISASTISATNISGGEIVGSTLKANGGSGVDTWIGNDGYLRFRYGSSNKAYMSSDSGGNMVIDSDGTIYMQADNEVSIVYNENGGGNNFYIWDDDTVAFFLDSEQNAYFSNGDVWAAGNIQCGNTFLSSDGTAGANKGPYGFVTAVESSRAKFREITTKDGLVTNISSESDWL